MSMLRRFAISAQNATIQVLARTMQRIGLTDITSNAYIVFQTSGRVIGYNNTAFNSGATTSNNFIEYDWRVGGASSRFDIRYVRTGGTEASLSGGLANNTWYNMSTDRTMYLLQDAPSATPITFNGTVAIKYNANSTIISSAACSWKSQQESPI